MVTAGAIVCRGERGGQRGDKSQKRWCNRMRERTCLVMEKDLDGKKMRKWMSKRCVVWRKGLNQSAHPDLEKVNDTESSIMRIWLRK